MSCTLQTKVATPGTGVRRIHQLLHLLQKERWQADRPISLSLSIIIFSGFWCERHSYLTSSHGVRCFICCCKSAGTVSSIPAYLYCLKVPNANLIRLIDYIPGQVPVPPARSASAYVQVLLSQSIVWIITQLWFRKGTLDSSFRVSPPVWVHCPSGSLTVLTLLVACFSVIFMSLALPDALAISWQYLLHEDHLAF
jgi:hypothetical protein